MDTQYHASGKGRDPHQEDYSIGGFMKKMFASTFSALLLLLVLTSAAFAAPAAEKIHLRFNGSLHAVEVGDLSRFPIISVTANGSGKGSQLGRFKYSYTVDIYLDPQTNSGPGTLYYTFVAANGDRLYSVGDGFGAPAAGIPNTNHVVEKHTITGGSGRFAGATGKFTVDRLVSNGITSGTFDGYIVLAKDH